MTTTCPMARREAGAPTLVRTIHSSQRLDMTSMGMPDQTVTRERIPARPG